MKTSVFGVAALATLLVLVSASVVLAATTSTTCIYSLGPYGDASIKIKYYNPDGILVLTVPLEKNALASTMLVYNENGTPLDFTVKNNEAIIDAANSTTVWVEYSAIVGNTTDNIVNATIHPVGPATIYLPRGAALLGFNGTAVVDYVSDRIVLRYSSGGTYNIVYLVPPQTTTTTTTSTTTTPATTTTTSTTTTRTTTTTSTTTTPAQTTTTTTTTKAATTTPRTTTTTPVKTTPQTTTGKPASTTTTATTTQASQKAPGGAATTGGKTGEKTATGTQATSTATKSPTTSSPPTSTTPIRRSNKAQAIATIIAVIAVIIVLALVLSRRRGGGGPGTGTFIDAGNSPGAGGGTGTAEVTLISSSLDERDKAILDLLSKEGPLGVSEVARRLGISKSTAWRKLQKLVDMGLVERVVVNGTPLYRAKK